MNGAGKLLGCFGLTEAPDGMSAVKAIREGETYILNGTKTWVAGAPNANLAIIWAKVLLMCIPFTCMKKQGSRHVPRWHKLLQLR